MVACAPASKSNVGLESGEASTTGIIGGKDVAANDSPAQFSVLLYDTLKKSICSATLIGNNLVLTAAHCLGQDPRKLLVIFTQNLPKATQDMARTVVGAIGHPSWKMNLQRSVDHGDIAIVKYQGSTPPGYRATTVLPNPSALKNNSAVLLVGYGVNEVTKRAGAGILRQVMTTITNSQYSQTEVQVEQRYGRANCHGDSGGPAFLVANGNYYLWGISSRGAQGTVDQCNSYSIYTNILPFIPWLQTTARTLLATNQFSYAQQ